jgi:hypothetical protein
MRRRFLGHAAVLALVFAAALAAPQALAWGSMGHREVGLNAMKALPDTVPAFLRTPQAATAVGELAREPDRWKGSGKIHDTDRDPAHFLNLDDDDKVLGGGPLLSQLPPTREAYDQALRAAGAEDMTKVGYMPYAIVDDFQQVAKDFAYWRVDVAAEKLATTRERKAWFARDRAEREALILRDIGELAHYVGDGSQPLHVSIHYNGWGPFPNPQGFTQERIHAPFEGIFVHNNISAEDSFAAMTSYRRCEDVITLCVADYLKTTRQQVVPLYTLQSAGAFEGGGTPEGRAFVAARLGAGASELRDLIVDAWKASGDVTVGYPVISVRDVEAGKVDAYPSLYGQD